MRDPMTGRVFVADRAAGEITVIDPKRNAVIGTIEPGAWRLEFAVADGGGHCS